MVIKSLKIKKQSYYHWNDIIFIDDLYCGHICVMVLDKIF